MMLVQIAWRNVWRNRGRSLVVMMAMVVGISSVIFLMAFSWGMYDYRIKEAIEKESSHIQIHNPKYKEFMEAKFTIADANQLDQKLGKDSRVKAVSNRFVVMGMALSSRSNVPARIIGVDTLEENKTTDLSGSLTEGEYFTGTKGIPVLVGEKLAKDLKLGLKKKPVLQFQDANGDMTAIKVKIVGLYKTNNSMFDGMNVFIPKEALQNAAKIKGVNEIAILLNDARDVDDVKTELQSGTKSMVETWKESIPELAIAIDTFDKTMFIIVLILFLAVAIGIINTMLMAVLERVREIGMLMAVGMNKDKVFSMFMLETIFLSLAGAPIGIFLGWALVAWGNHSGINLSMYGEGLSSMGFSNMVYPSLPVKDYFILTGEIIVISILAALVPAYRSLRLNPATAIRKI
ncbi:MAG: FtsX-like permease family protein [Bacteroidetes bacterium]|nr:FtsX-like permease family protein [Bacteroidota bacterium]